MFANITDFAHNYNKNNKTYEEICQDYTFFANKFVTFLFLSTDKIKSLNMMKQYPTIIKCSYFRELPVFPISSLMECLTIILKQNLQIDINLKSNIKVEELPKIFMKIYKIVLALSEKNKANNVNHFSFNHFQMFKIVELFCK